MNLSFRTTILILILITSCNNPKFNTEKETSQINIILDNWHKDAKKANFDSYFNKISENGFYIGTDKSENWSQKEFKTFCKPYFKKKTTWDFKTIERNIYFSKNKEVVWFNELLDTWMGTCRGSGILEKENNEWKIKQYVLSVTIPNNEIKKVIEIKGNAKAN